MTGTETPLKKRCPLEKSLGVGGGLERRRKTSIFPFRETQRMSAIHPSTGTLSAFMTAVQEQFPSSSTKSQLYKPMLSKNTKVKGWIKQGGVSNMLTADWVCKEKEALMGRSHHPLLFVYFTSSTTYWNLFCFFHYQNHPPLRGLCDLKRAEPPFLNTGKFM